MSLSWFSVYAQDFGVLFYSHARTRTHTYTHSHPHTQNLVYKGHVHKKPNPTTLNPKPYTQVLVYKGHVRKNDSTGSSSSSSSRPVDDVEGNPVMVHTMRDGQSILFTNDRRASPATPLSSLNPKP